MYFYGGLIKKVRICSFGFWVLFTFLFSNIGNSQPDYNMKLTNGVKVNDNTIEFDVLVKGVQSTFTLTSYQCSFSFNSSIANGGELMFNYIDGTSELINLPTFAIGINTDDNQSKLTFASMPGADIVNEANIRVGRFRLTNTIAFANLDPNIQWNFTGNVSTILTGDNFQNITAPLNHTSNLTLASNPENTDLPTEFKLLQNYPNPFNPTTNISFDLPKESHVSLTVYNILGQEVGQLVNERFDAGSHSVEFIGNSLASGTYICKLDVNKDFVQTIKMILMK